MRINRPTCEKAPLNAWNMPPTENNSAIDSMLERRAARLMPAAREGESDLPDLYSVLACRVESQLRPTFLRELQIHARGRKIGHVAGSIESDIGAS